jgi:signal peptidase I
MKASVSLRRPGLGDIARWSGVLVVLALLIVALLALPFQLYAVKTGSMEPTFGPRDLVLVHKGQYQQGQPISFTHYGEVITHRLVSVNADGTFVTRGDANGTPDPWVVQRREILGGVVASVPQMGYWLVYLKSLPGLASLIVAVVGIRLLWSLAREFDDERGEDVKPPPFVGLPRTVHCPDACRGPTIGANICT